MNVPETVRAGVESALEGHTGRPTNLRDARPVGGGCISPTARISTGGGDIFFLKWSSPDLPDGLLSAEARGLRELMGAGSVRVPEVVGLGETEGTGWLLLEWLEPGGAGPESWKRLGRDLAGLHRVRGQQFGSDEDNYIGSLPQENTPTPDWPVFWRDRRLEPQRIQAHQAGLLTAEDQHRFEALYDRLPQLLGPAADDGASLLHGDLWSGNVHILKDGTPAIIDPSVYRGHREVDLAMAELFGGFGSAFFDAYDQQWPLARGYAPVRRAVYQLYYLLVHVNLFGASYVGRTRSALAAAGV